MDKIAVLESSQAATVGPGLAGLDVRIGANVGVIVVGIRVNTGATVGEAVSSGPHLPHVRRHSMYAPVICSGLQYMVCRNGLSIKYWQL